MRELPLALLVVLVACTPSEVPAEPPAPPHDPIVEDPESFDAEFPAEIRNVEFPSGGDLLNGIVYVAQGAGPHPTLVLLHGLPGFERNLDLAQAVRRAGWNVFFFHYRGAWGSGGIFKLAHLPEDALAAVALARDAEFAATHRVDPQRVALAGHSGGGWATMMAGKDPAAPGCLISIAGAHAFSASPMLESEEGRAQGAALLDTWTAPLAGTSGAALVEELVAHAADWSPVDRPEGYDGKRILLVGGTRDADTPLDVNHAPLFEALTALEIEVEEKVFESDHSFSDRRIALARTVVEFLDRCMD